MLQFIPFEDDWDALERLRPEDLIPYRVGLLPEPSLPARTPGSGAALACGPSLATTPARHAARSQSPEMLPLADPVAGPHAVSPRCVLVPAFNVVSG